MTHVFDDISTSTLGHLTDTGYLNDIQLQVPNRKMVGRIITAKIYPPDAGILREALIAAQEGEVLAIECAVNDHYACWGELRNLAAQIKKLAGVIIAGNITDCMALRAQPLPVFARGVSALTTRASSNTSNGELNTPITLSGVTIHPGDIAIGDDDGLFVFSEDYATNILTKAQDKEQRDYEIKRTLLSQLAQQINPIGQINNGM